MLQETEDAAESTLRPQVLSAQAITPGVAAGATESQGTAQPQVDKTGKEKILQAKQTTRRKPRGEKEQPVFEQ